MTRPLMLCLPLKTFEVLHKIANGRGKKVSVNRADLSILLIDHARALAKLQDMQIPIEDDYGRSSTVRQARK
jgi:hypothetical protein